MASWLDNAEQREPTRNEWLGYLAIALMPAFSLGAYFGLDFLLQWLAGRFV